MVLCKKKFTNPTLIETLNLAQPLEDMNIGYK